MKKIVLLFGAGIVLVSTVMNGQQISQKVLQEFNPSIISKVYNVTAKLGLSQNEQLALAKAYELDDSLVCVTLKDGRSVSGLNANHVRSSLVCRYDSLMEQSRLREKQIGYISARIQLLHQIKALSTEQNRRILDIFISKCKLPDCTYGDAFKQTLPKVLKDTVYYANIYKVEIKQQVSEATNAYPLRNNLPMAILKDCRGIISNYQQALITIDYAYPGVSKEKISLVESIHTHYKPRIDSILVRTGYFSPVTVFSSAIRKKQILKLTDSQVDLLNAKTAELERISKEYTLKNPDEVYNADEFNHKSMLSILSEDQYRTFLQLKLQKKTEQICANTFKEMIKYGTATPADSLTTTRGIYYYNLEKLVIGEIYQDRPILKVDKWRDIEASKPESIKKMEKARKLARNNSTKVETKTSFVW
jgi:hypothetical protein